MLTRDRVDEFLGFERFAFRVARSSGSSAWALARSVDPAHSLDGILVIPSALSAISAASDRKCSPRHASTRREQIAHVAGRLLARTSQCLHPHGGIIQMPARQLVELSREAHRLFGQGRPLEGPAQRIDRGARLISRSRQRREPLGGASRIGIFAERAREELRRSWRRPQF